MGGNIDPNPQGRNKRSVWTVDTRKGNDAHSAGYPEALIEPCVLAGAPEGGIVLDPFMGTWTTAAVALKNRRRFIGCELSEEYCEIGEKRLSPLLNQQDITEMSW